MRERTFILVGDVSLEENRQKKTTQRFIHDAHIGQLNINFLGTVNELR